MDRSSADTIISFYSQRNPGTDFLGRSLSDILAYTDDQLEHSHNYIQVLFPLPEGSPFNLSAPIIDEVTFHRFHASIIPSTDTSEDDNPQQGLIKAFRRMCAFYGFELQYPRDPNGEARALVAPLADEVQRRRRFRNWVMPFNHNHLRITRIIRCLRVLGKGDEAKAFSEALKEVDRRNPRRIGGRSLAYWQRAAERPLNVAPDDNNEGEATGPGFLWGVY
ncbi:MAG: hypothetical protein Q9160_004160 [Pyrenula sp. 1 TL-2023]